MEGDFFDGEEFIPVIESDRGHLKMDVADPEEVNNDFDDDVGGIALPVDRDDQSVSTFNYP